MPLASPIYIRFPRYRLPIQLSALVVVCLGIVCTAFASRPYHIVLSLGVAYGFGGAFLYQPGKPSLRVSAATMLDITQVWRSCSTGSIVSGALPGASSGPRQVDTGREPGLLHAADSPRYRRGDISISHSSITRSLFLQDNPLCLGECGICDGVASILIPPGHQLCGDRVSGMPDNPTASTTSTDGGAAWCNHVLGWRGRPAQEDTPQCHEDVALLGRVAVHLLPIPGLHHPNDIHALIRSSTRTQRYDGSRSCGYRQSSAAPYHFRRRC